MDGNGVGVGVGDGGCDQTFGGSLVMMVWFMMRR